MNVTLRWRDVFDALHDAGDDLRLMVDRVTSEDGVNPPKTELVVQLCGRRDEYHHFVVLAEGRTELPK